MEKEENKVDLNAPAFGPGAQVIEVEDATTPFKADAKNGGEDNSKGTLEASEEESKVPYSRFKKFHDAAKEAQADAEHWRQEAERLAALQISSAYNKQADAAAAANSATNMPNYWRELYGDSEASLKAWRVQEAANQQLMEQTRQAALEAVQNERYAEVERTEQNMEVLDDNLDTLSAYVGRELTDKEQGEILDIVDDYTPKDELGNYAGPLIPFEKAWEIYELRTQTSKAPGIKSRNAVASLGSSQSRGEASVTQQDGGGADASFNPLDWNAWKKRV